MSETYAQIGSSSPELISVADSLREFDRIGLEVHHVFFGVAGIIWYTLMYQSRLVPRWLFIWGIVAVGVAGSSSIFLLDTDIDLFFLAFPTGLFELLMGLARRQRARSQRKGTARHQPSRVAHAEVKRGSRTYVSKTAGHSALSAPRRSIKRSRTRGSPDIS